jgi:hypothetical protein
LSSIDEPELSFIYKKFHIWDPEERKHLRKVFVLKRPYLEEFLFFLDSVSISIFDQEEGNFM